MGEPPYDDPDPLDLMRADADQVSLGPTSSLDADYEATEADAEGFDVPADAVTLCGELHFHLD